ncbi:MAG TPA: ABC transporter ATP-binding protein [Magnetovibrio sp.]
MTELILQTQDLCKTFGGVTAVQSVNLDVQAGHLHALIGPNGAGKSTLLNLLSGELDVSAGTVFFNGQDITPLKPHQTARLGIGRSFQRPTVLAKLSCFENVWLGARAQSGSAMRFFRPARSNQALVAKTMETLAKLGLEANAETPAHALSHGEQRQLEIAMMLATDPQLLLMDEPLAGLGAEESTKMAAVIRSLAGSHTIILVEHDMDAVFAIADRVTVLVEGSILQTDTPSAIQSSQAVQDAYLGHTDAETPA